MIINTWFWSSGLGPGPSAGTGGGVGANGLAGPAIRKLKKRPTAIMVASVYAR